MFKKYKTKNARIGARALKRYHKSQKRKKWLSEKPDATVWMVSIYAILGGIIMRITSSWLIGLLVVGICLWLSYLWYKGRIL